MRDEDCLEIQIQLCNVYFFLIEIFSALKIPLLLHMFHVACEDPPLIIHCSSNSFHLRERYSSQSED